VQRSSRPHVEKPDFWPMSKYNTGTCNKKKQTSHFRTYSRRAWYDLLQTLRGDRARRARQKGTIHFSIQRSFSYRVQGKIRPNIYIVISPSSGSNTHTQKQEISKHS